MLSTGCYSATRNLDKTNFCTQYNNREIKTFCGKSFSFNLNQWELVENLKKTLAVVASLFVSKSGAIQALVMIAVLVIMLRLQSNYRPMNEDTETGGTKGNNTLQSCLLVLEIGHLFFELLFELKVISEGVATAVLLFLIFFGYLLFFSPSSSPCSRGASPNPLPKLRQWRQKREGQGLNEIAAVTVFIVVFSDSSTRRSIWTAVHRPGKHHVSN